MMQLKRLIGFGLAALALGGSVGYAEPRPLNVVATTPELGSLASALTGERARVRTITSGREDPHFLQARPTFMVMARDADVWIRNGLELEIGWEPLLLDGARNPDIRVGRPRHFDAGAVIPYILEVPGPSVTRAHGDVHPSGNPHYMLDPLIARAVAVALAGRLGEIDPQHKDVYDANLAVFLKRLSETMFGAALVGRIGAERLWAAEEAERLVELLAAENAVAALGGWRGAMRAWEGRPIITFHKSWSYLARRFGLRVIAELEPLPGVPPSPAHLARVIELARERNVSLLLREPFYPARPAEFVAAEVPGLRVAVVSSHATDSSAEGYFALMDAVIAAFRE